MTIFHVKKTRESPDQCQVEMVEINVPNEVFMKILTMLDGRSLHTARQVCKEWNSAIKAQVLGTVEGRREMKRTLQHQWREATPTRLEFTIEGLARVQILTFTDQFAVISSQQTKFSKDKISVVNIKEGVKMMEYSCSKGGQFLEALLSEDVLLLVWKVYRELEVVAWNVHSRRKIFDKKLPTGSVVFDHRNRQVMVGKKTRLEIRGNRIKLHSVAPLPRSRDLRAFAHPHYLTGGPGAGAATLWKVDGTKVSRVGDLGAGGGGGSPVFCPAREIIVSSSVLPPDKIRFKVFSSQSGQIIKDRHLTSPTIFYGISRLQVNDNQVVVMVRQQPGSRVVLLVYELECLLSESTDQDISPRMFDLGHLQDASSYLTNTSVSAGLEGIITLDFWNCEN